MSFRIFAAFPGQLRLGLVGWFLTAFFLLNHQIRINRTQKPKSESKIDDYKILMHPISIEKRIERFPTGGGTQITKGSKNEKS